MPSASVAAHAPAATSDSAVAFSFLAQLSTEISKRQLELPCFPEVVLRIRRALSDPKTSTDKLVSIIAAEPRLAAKLLQMANSAACGVTGRPCTDVKTAVLRLGQAMVQTSVMAFALTQLRDTAALKLIAKDLQVLWARSVRVAAICQVLARAAKLNGDEAMLMGLMHGIGKLYILSHAVTRDSKLVQNHQLIDLVGDWHPGIAKAVLEYWEFPEEICEAVAVQSERDRPARRPADLADVLIVAVVFAEAMELGQSCPGDIDSIPSFAVLDLNADRCQSVALVVNEHLKALKSALSG
jgi:HD-like signal output (HDOD) protein